MAKCEHGNNGHWGHDLIKLQLMDRIYSPQLDQSITLAPLECPQCKNFGSSHLHALMYPIMHQYPFKLLVADYLSLPKCKGGYHSILLILDTYSHFTWGFKFKTSGAAKTALSHFNNGDVCAWCEVQGTTHHGVMAYALWINGLVKNANRKLLGRLKCLCSPSLGEDDYESVKPEDITKTWPDHFDATIRQLNERIIPSLQFSPKELLLGFIINTTRTPTTTATAQPSQHDVNIQMLYVDQQHRTEQVTWHFTRSNGKQCLTTRYYGQTLEKSYSQRIN